jgi:hypothetical protein
MNESEDMEDDQFAETEIESINDDDDDEDDEDFEGGDDDEGYF